ncbi:YidH family protein [Tropicimonas isoalkanivorans]|uniref:Putative membrane protein n=1 Tax=Tropicimonas isoalkanivorans TaxID=441112 RepID=A0A1I1MGL9_9RHOB|nr:DUF202 domain-containing protein [Tropicimonas isoalkanivorans]SFC84507.1 putative membrane protein [Tropicimonas isoalkanivorans]
MTDKTELAEERTEWAEDRTVLANERTFAAWLHTSMAAIALAVGLKAVFAPTEPTWIAKSVASVFIAVSIILSTAALRQAIRTNRRLHSFAAKPQPLVVFRVITAVMMAGALLVGWLLWAL